MVYLKENYWPTIDLNVAACRLIINLIQHNMITQLETPVVLKNVSKSLIYKINVRKHIKNFNF